MNDIKDVKPPVNMPDLWWLLWLLLALIVVAAVVYFVLRYKKSPQAPVVPQVPLAVYANTKTTTKAKELITRLRVF